MHFRAKSVVYIVSILFGACVSHDANRKIDYGGEPWRLADIFPEGPNRLLAAAAARGDLAGIGSALRSGADVNFRGAHDLTPLWWSAWDQNIAGFTRLLEGGGNPNVVPSRNNPVMHNISEAFWPTSFLKVALKYGGNPDLEDQNGRRPIAVAIIQGTREHLDLLLAAGARLNSMREDGGGAPIHAAVMAGRFDYVLLLLEKGADPKAKNRRGHDLAYLIGLFPYDPNSEHYVWRERVIRFLRNKGIEAYPPPNEGHRTKPLPPDLRVTR